MIWIFAITGLWSDLVMLLLKNLEPNILEFIFFLNRILSIWFPYGILRGKVLGNSEIHVLWWLSLCLKMVFVIRKLWSLQNSINKFLFSSALFFPYFPTRSWFSISDTRNFVFALNSPRNISTCLCLMEFISDDSCSYRKCVFHLDFSLCSLILVLNRA